MKVRIEKKVCIKHKTSSAEVLTIMATRDTEDIVGTLAGLAAKGLLQRNDNGKYVVTPQGNKLVDTVLAESLGRADIEERLTELAPKMRECFPAGKMPGTAFYYRCNNREVILKMKKFFEIYGDYTDEQILSACRRFVASYDGNHRYLPLIKYFILKSKIVPDEQGVNHVTEVSELASYLENGERDVVNENPDNWLINTRN